MFWILTFGYDTFLQLIEEFINSVNFERTGKRLDDAQVKMIWSWAVSIFCVGGMIGGSLTGFVSERLGRFVSHDQHHPCDVIHFAHLTSSVITAKIGITYSYRKGGLLLNNVFAFLAAALLGFSKLAGSYEMIIAGRFFIGLNSGLNAGIAPMYLTEVSPTHLRGAVSSYFRLLPFFFFFFVSVT